MSYDGEMASDKASKALANSPPGVVDRFKINVSHLANKCTFGKVGTNKYESGACPYSK